VNPTPATVVAVGAGHATVSAVRMLRRRGFGGRLVVLGDERHAPYQRPPLSKEYLRGDADLEDVTILDPSWCRTNDVELLLGTRAERISADGSGHRVHVAGGDELVADAVLVATGVRARRLPGVQGDRILHLRDLDDAERLRALLPGAGRIVVLGAGLIGSEVAASARDLGVEVTCLEAAAVPLAGQLGPRMAGVYADLHRENGVDLRCGRQVESVVETASGVVVRTGSGDVVEAALLVVAVGAVPNDELARVSGLPIDPVAGGVLVDAECRTAVAGVFAAGDIASRFDPAAGVHARIEHFDNAGRQGAVVARAVLGLPQPAEDPAWFWSDQYELGLQFVGRPRPDATVVVRGSVDDRDFIAFYLHDGRVGAAFAVDRGGDVTAARELISRDVPVTEELLADEDTDLLDLLDPIDA
jgi:3-phenylpropionate/trans-cinnamate dioxygenase ferredoxin reductase component